MLGVQEPYYNDLVVADQVLKSCYEMQCGLRQKDDGVYYVVHLYIIIIICTQGLIQGGGGGGGGGMDGVVSHPPLGMVFVENE